MKTYKTLADLPANFWAKVNKTPDGCWRWTGANVREYGQFNVDGKRVYVHRLTYRLAHRLATLPAGMQIDHLCRVRSCLNPDHLELVTARENTMRSAAVSALNARKTTCPKDHPFTDLNTYVDPRGYRQCRACRQDSKRRSRRRARGAA